MKNVNFSIVKKVDEMLFYKTFIGSKGELVDPEFDVANLDLP